MLSCQVVKYFVLYHHHYSKVQKFNQNSCSIIGSTLYDFVFIMVLHACSSYNWRFILEKKFVRWISLNTNTEQRREIHIKRVISFELKIHINWLPPTLCLVLIHQEKFCPLKTKNTLLNSGGSFVLVQILTNVKWHTTDHCFHSEK